MKKASWLVVAALAGFLVAEAIPIIGRESLPTSTPSVRPLVAAEQESHPVAMVAEFDDVETRQY